MLKIDELFEKIIYESEDFKIMQKGIDDEIEALMEKYGSMDNSSKEVIRDELVEILYKTERESFEIGLRYGVQLMSECCPPNEDIK